MSFVLKAGYSQVFIQGKTDCVIYFYDSSGLYVEVGMVNDRHVDIWSIYRDRWMNSVALDEW